MKTLLALLLLATVASAAPAPAMARQRTVAEDDLLRDWITGIMEEAQQATAEAEQAEREAKESRAQSAIVKANLGQAVDRIISLDTQIIDLGKDRDSERAAKEAALAQVEAEKKKTAEEKKGRLAAEAHLSRIKTWLGAALGIALALAVQMLPWKFLPIPWNLYGRAAATVAALGAGWLIVARFA